MTDNWSQCGLTPSTADERGRFHVSHSTIEPGSLVSRRGDVFLGRG